jgi:hypothetical protein
VNWPCNKDRAVRSLSRLQLFVIAYVVIALVFFAGTATVSFYRIQHPGSWWTSVTYQFSYALAWPIAIPLQLAGHASFQASASPAQSRSQLPSAMLPPKN